MQTLCATFPTRVVLIGCLATAVCVAPLRASAQETLIRPPILKNLSTEPKTVEVNLTAAPVELSLLPGLESEVYAYNGSIPGPTLEVHEGDRVIVHFKNDLPEDTTVHWHGIHLPAEADGNPMDLVAPGDSYDYVFTIHPGTAGTYWYHPHPHERSGPQLAKGLFGAMIVRAADDPLPPSLPEKLLLLSDNRFDETGAIMEPDTDDELHGREGNVLFVNGQIRPMVAIRSGEVQRWRVVNASIARYYRLALPGHTFLRVGSDGGLFEHPVPENEVLLAPAERAELLVAGSGAPGSKPLLRSLPYDRYAVDYRPADWDQSHDLLTVQYRSDPPITPPVIPATLRPVPVLDPARATATHTLILHKRLINDMPFDMDRVDITAPLGATEIWRVVNQDPTDHPFHLHAFPFQVLDGRGLPIPVWKDTVNVPKEATMSFIVQYLDYPGKRMFHCHILDHEDHGMMGILEVQ